MTQEKGSTPQHKNDIYGDASARSENDAGVQKPIPAATVVLLREGSEGLEVLMLRKNSKITFGGMWVFPGGKVDDADRRQNDLILDDEQAARRAAAREAHEETGVEVDPAEFAWFAHWTPPPGPQKRFATWFFATQIGSDVNVVIDDGEIKECAWMSPQTCLQRHADGEIDLAPPTWVTLNQLTLHTPLANLMKHLQEQSVKVYATRISKDQQGHRVAMWTGDAGYEPWDATVAGERHRLVMKPGAFTFENSVENY